MDQPPDLAALEQRIQQLEAKLAALQAAQPAPAITPEEYQTYLKVHQAFQAAAQVWPCATAQFAPVWPCANFQLAPVWPCASAVAPAPAAPAAPPAAQSEEGATERFDKLGS